MAASRRAQGHFRYLPTRSLRNARVLMYYYLPTRNFRVLMYCYGRRMPSRSVRHAPVRMCYYLPSHSARHARVLSYVMCLRARYTVPEY